MGDSRKVYNIPEVSTHTTALEQMRTRKSLDPKRLTGEHAPKTAFVIMGHGSETGSIKQVPKGCILVVQVHSGEVNYIGQNSIFVNIFNDTKKQQFLDPVQNYKHVTEIINKNRTFLNNQEKSLAIYREFDYYPDFTYTLISSWRSDTQGQTFVVSESDKLKYRLQDSGIAKYPFKKGLETEHKPEIKVTKSSITLTFLRQMITRDWQYREKTSKQITDTMWQKFTELVESTVKNPIHMLIKCNLISEEFLEGEGKGNGYDNLLERVSSAHPELASSNYKTTEKTSEFITIIFWRKLTEAYWQEANSTQESFSDENWQCFLNSILKFTNIRFLLALLKDMLEITFEGGGNKLTHYKKDIYIDYDTQGTQAFLSLFEKSIYPVNSVLEQTLTNLRKNYYDDEREYEDWNRYAESEKTIKNIIDNYEIKRLTTITQSELFDMAIRKSLGFEQGVFYNLLCREEQNPNSSFVQNSILNASGNVKIPGQILMKIKEALFHRANLISKLKIAKRSTNKTKKTKRSDTKIYPKRYGPITKAESNRRETYEKSHRERLLQNAE
jgi:hypothetical protein